VNVGTVAVRNGAGGQDAARRALADQISEEVLQLLYAVHGDLAEVLDAGEADADPALIRSAAESTLGAISILRVVVETVLTAAWGPAQRRSPSDASWPGAEGVLFDALSDAWVVTCSDRDLLFASGPACELLGRSSEDLRELFRDKAELLRRLEGGARVVADDGTVESDVEVPLPDGDSRRVHVLSHPLPAVPGVKRSYLSLLSERL
jgi:PAS domain-containing protein